MLHICICTAVLSFVNSTLLHPIISSSDPIFRPTFIIACVDGLRGFIFFWGLTKGLICILIVMIIFEQGYYFSRPKFLSLTPQTLCKSLLDHANIFKTYAAISHANLNTISQSLNFPPSIDKSPYLYQLFDMSSHKASLYFSSLTLISHA